MSCIITNIIQYWLELFIHKCKHVEKWKEIRVGPLKDEQGHYIGHYSDYVRHCVKCGEPEHKRVEWKDN